MFFDFHDQGVDFFAQGVQFKVDENEQKERRYDSED